MRRKFMATISAVLVLVMFAGSTLAFAEPKGDVQIEQFPTLQGVQTECISDQEMGKIEGMYLGGWKWVWKLTVIGWQRFLCGPKGCAKA